MKKERPGMYFEKLICKLPIAGLSIIMIVLLLSCEGKERFYRPNLPEQLCCVGIIDADDTLRRISFEKSYQAEYSDGSRYLQDFSFTISSSEEEIFNYQGGLLTNKMEYFKIPDSISFEPNVRYYLKAKEKTTPEISAEVSLPETPSTPSLISINKETLTLSEPDCAGIITVIPARSAVISFAFTKNNLQKMFYAILVEGTGHTWSSLYFLPQSGLLDFAVRESNSPGFFSELHGFKMYRYICDDNKQTLTEFSAFAYFIDGSKIPGNKCKITLSIQFDGLRSPYHGFKSIRIKLLSIPETLYLFEKSLYIHKQIDGDPFSEPVYLNGNIKNGNGVFAICRSSELIVDLSTPY